MSPFYLFLIHAVLLGVSSPAYALGKRNNIHEQVLCPKWTIQGLLSPGLTSFEKRLICGDENRGEKGARTWRDVPISQGRFFLKNFLQQRGYHQPKFRKENDVIFVSVGEKSTVSQVDVEGADPSVVVERKRDILGASLTPKTLESFEGWIRREHENQGYGCPEVQTEASVDTGTIKVHVKPGVRQNLVSMTEDEIQGVAPGTFSRYQAFDLGQTFNMDLLKITEARVLSQGAVESNHFQTRCTSEGVHVNHRLIAGPPRLVGIGFGVSTEAAVRARVNWTHTRLGDRASRLDFSATGSFKAQTFRSTVDWYLLREPSRWKLRSEAYVSHENQEHYQTLSSHLETGIARTWDQYEAGILWFLGPSLEWIKSQRGDGASQSKFVNLENRITVQSHQFEYYGSKPRRGYRFSILTDLNHQSLLSDTSAQRIQIKGESLWNYKNYDPSLWVLGLRGGLTTILTGDRVESGTRLPSNFLQYLGGSTDLRGFGLQELPRKPVLGGLTSAFLGLELRLTNTLPKGFDPFVFIDFGAIGRNPVSLDLPIYRSPGGGLRWDSPIGVFRSSVAYGFSGQKNDHFQFFINFGEEF